MGTIQHGQVVKCCAIPKEGKNDSVWWQLEMVGGVEEWFGKVLQSGICAELQGRRGIF